MTNIPNDEDIYLSVRKAIAETLRQPEEVVTPDSRLGEDLGGESLDFVEIEYRLETEFGVEFYHGNAIERLGELLTPRELERDGLLTGFGAAVLRLRLPEIDPGRLCEGRPVTGIQASFTPRTWVRAVKELLEARPTSCPHCGSDQLVVAEPSVLCCDACDREVACPDGEICLVAWARRVTPQLEELQPKTG